MPELIHRQVDQQRQVLIHLIEIRRPQGSLNNKVTIVFDGTAGIYSQPESSVVRVVFSQQESADERIKKSVCAVSQRKNFIVVTDDRSLQYAVRALGARVITVRSFLEKVGSLSSGQQKKNSQGDSPDEKKHIPKEQELKITLEMRKIWLKEKSKD